MARKKTFTRKIINYLRVALCYFTSALTAGLLPGQAMFIQMFVDFGIDSTLCPEKGVPCTEQQLAVSSGFNIGLALSMLCQLPVGWLFDRYGAHTCCVWGGFMVFFGLLLLQIPLLAVSQGYDSHTSWLFPIIITFTDAGSMGSAYAAMGMVYHFPGQQTLVLALWSCGSVVTPALLPNALELWMQHTGMDLPSSFAMYALVVGLSTTVMCCVVPSQEEYLEEAKECLGMPLPDPSQSPSLWYCFRRGLEVARVHKSDHVAFVLTLSTVFCAYNVFQSMLGAYEDVLLGSRGAGDYITQMSTLLLGSVGTVVSVCVSVAIDSSGNNSIILMFGFFAFLMFLMSVLVAGATWFQQLACVSLGCIMTCLVMVADAKYVLAYVMPTQVGMLIGVLSVANVVIMTCEISVYYAILSMMQPEQIPTFMTVMFVVSTSIMGAYALRFAFHKLPEMPVVLPDDEKMICEPFGYSRFDEILYALDMSKEEKPMLLKLMCEPTQEGMKELQDRLESARGAFGFLSRVAHSIFC